MKKNNDEGEKQVEPYKPVQFSDNYYHQKVLSEKEN